MTRLAQEDNGGCLYGLYNISLLYVYYLTLHLPRTLRGVNAEKDIWKLELRPRIGQLTGLSPILLLLGERGMNEILKILFTEMALQGRSQLQTLQDTVF